MVTAAQRKIINAKLDAINAFIKRLERLKQNLNDAGFEDVGDHEGRAIDCIVDQLQDLELSISISLDVGKD